jgi:protein MpaA
VAVAALIAATLAVGAPVPVRHEIVGRSVRGAPIRATVVGDPAAPRAVLVVACLHGNEPAGMSVIRRLRRARPPAGTVLWLIGRANPDGCRAGTRHNARGVDLNRNAPWRWRRTGPPGSTFYAGRRPASEPETRALLRLVRRVRPIVTIWYHQAAALVDDSGGDRHIERRYAELSGLPLCAAAAAPPRAASRPSAGVRVGRGGRLIDGERGGVSARAVRDHGRRRDLAWSVRRVHTGYRRQPPPRLRPRPARPPCGELTPHTGANHPHPPHADSRAVG